VSAGEKTTYIVRLIGTGQLKIGETTQINDRLDSLSSHYKCDIEMICLLSDGESLYPWHREGHVHRRFQSLRIGNTERFADAPCVADWIQSLHPMYRGSFTRKRIDRETARHSGHRRTAPMFRGFDRAEEDTDIVCAHLPTVEECAAVRFGWQVTPLNSEERLGYSSNRQAAELAARRGGEPAGYRWSPMPDDEWSRWDDECDADLCGCDLAACGVTA
jgi:hypothetical protein